MADEAIAIGGIILIIAIVILLVYLVRKKSSRSETIHDLMTKTGFNQSDIVSSKTTTSGDKTVTSSTDKAGNTITTTKSKDGSSTSTVKDKNGTTVGTQSTPSLLNQLVAATPVLVTGVAVGIARDLVIEGGAKLVQQVSTEVSEKGVKRSLQQGGKLVSREGTDMAMKFLGYFSSTAAENAANNAAEVGLRKIAKEAAEKAVTDELKNNAVKYGGKKLASEVTDTAAKEALTKTGQRAAEDATTKAVEAAGKKTVQTVADKALIRGGKELAIKAASRAGIMAAKMGAKAGMGPVGWALMAFDLASLALDIACCGGYCEVADTATWTKQRDNIIAQVQALVDDANKSADGTPDPDPVRWPIITGPFDNFEKSVLEQKIQEKMSAAILDPNNVYAKPVMEKIKAAIAAKTITDSDQIVPFLIANIDISGLSLEATKNVCTDVKGKVIMDGSIYAGCSWPDQSSCEGSFKWGKDTFTDNSTYSVWNSSKQECNKDPVSLNMRILCDQAGFPFNKDTKICDLNEKYCLMKGLKWDGKNCKLSEGQNIAEMMFGTTMVRGLNSVFSTDQYEACPPGSRPATEIAVLAGAYTMGVGTAYAQNTLCASDNCKPDQDNVSGLCYDKCKPGYDDKADAAGNKVQGMCYKCPDGYTKDTLGMCKKDGCADTEELGSGIGIARQCYPKCTIAFGPEYTDSDGSTLCLKKCPPGMRTERITCMRDVVVKQAGSAPKTCPAGWDTTIPGPAGMCRQQCTDGYKMYGGICYHPNVDTSLLVKIPSKGGCPDGQRDDGTSCWEDHSTHCDHGGHRGWLLLGCHSKGCGCIRNNLFDRQTCPDGYSLQAGMCYAVSHPIQPNKSIIEVGECNDTSKPEGDGGMCYQKCSDFGGSFYKSAAGLCTMDAMSTSRDPKSRGVGVAYHKIKMADQYSRNSTGISYKVFPKKRRVPFGKGPNGC